MMKIDTQAPEFFINRLFNTYVLLKNLLIELRGMTLIFYLSAFAHNTHQMIIFCLHRVLYVMVFWGSFNKTAYIEDPVPMTENCGRICGSSILAAK